MLWRVRDCGGGRLRGGGVVSADEIARLTHTPACLAARDAARTAMRITPARMAPLYIGAMMDASQDCPACVAEAVAPDTGAMWCVDYRKGGEGGVALFSDRADADEAMARWCMDGEPERVTVAVLRGEP